MGLSAFRPDWNIGLLHEVGTVLQERASDHNQTVEGPVFQEFSEGGSGGGGDGVLTEKQGLLNYQGVCKL